MLQIKKILFWGPLGNEKHFGGGESGNNRTIRVLEKMGFSVIRCPKPYPLSIPILRWPVYLIQLTHSILATGLKCVSCSAHALHVAGFYGHLIFWEWALLSMAQLLRIHATYEIRGGDCILKYNDGSPLYRFLFRKAITNADCVLCQGAVYIDFVRSLGANTVLYYPNYIYNLPLYDNNTTRPTDGIVRLVYFGRLSRDKRIDLAIRSVDVLLHLKVPCSLTLIGDDDGIVIAECKDLAKQLQIEDSVHWLSKMGKQELMEELKYYHFFVFPSENPREGHSNALMEAMAQGIVPICSDQGFNREVVAEAGVIVETKSAIDFAHAIDKIWSNGGWAKLSYEAWRNVATRFSIEMIETMFKEIYG